MATRVTVTSDGVTAVHSVPFPYLDKGHVKAKVNGASTTAFTWPTPSSIQFNTVPPAGQQIEIYRETPNGALTSYQTGSVLTKSDLETDSLQALYLVEELESDKLDRAGVVAVVEEAAVNGDAGILRADLNSSDVAKGAALVKFQPPDPGALALALSALLANGVPVTWYASAAQLAIDATAATQAAINYAISSGRRAVYFPGGITYNFAAASAALDPGTGDMTFYGDGWQSILQFNEGPNAIVSAAKHLFKNVSITAKGNLVFRDLQFKGKWSDNAYATGYGSALYLDSYNSVELHNCKFFNFAYMVTICERIRNVKVMGCVFEQCQRDMARFRSSFNVQVIGNRFKGGDDDAVALHTLDSIDSYNVREGIVVSGNVFEDVGGVRVLSGRMVKVTGNTFRRTKDHAIAIYATPSAGTEGDFSQFGVDVSHNDIYDTLARAPFTTGATNVIAIYSQNGKGGTETGGVVPGQPVVATGVFYRPWNYRDRNYAAAAESLPPQFYVRIQNNTIARTLPTVAAYDNWGFGQTVTATGYSNVAVSDVALRPTYGIYMEGNTRKAIVSHNIVAHVGSPVFFSEGNSNYALDDVLVDANLLSDYTDQGVGVNSPAATRHVGLVVRGNLFDADPYHIHSNRGAGGTWLALGAPYGVFANSHEGMTIEFNRFRNMAYPVNDGGNGKAHIRGNITRGQAAAGGFSVSNRGVGTTYSAGVQWRHEQYDSNPTSATYGQRLNDTLDRSSAMPSAGFYLAGSFVQNNDYIGLPGVHGWVRLTTGSAHVAGTDWKTVPLT